jgi:hypothetical protein
VTATLADLPRRRLELLAENALLRQQLIVHDCPYPLTVALEHFKVGPEYKYAALIHYRDDGLCPTLPAWFQHYNKRQT